MHIGTAPAAAAAAAAGAAAAAAAVVPRGQRAGRPWLLHPGRLATLQSMCMCLQHTVVTRSVTIERDSVLQGSIANPIHQSKLSPKS